MNTLAKPEVTFFRTKDAATKIKIICQKAEEFFKRQKRMLIAVPSLEAAQYVDLLLWRHPEESFIPHVLTSHPTQEWIAITVQPTLNLNKAQVLFNLCTNIPSISDEMDYIYEIFDETQTDKNLLSQERMGTYQSKGYIVHLI